MATRTRTELALAVMHLLSSNDIAENAVGSREERIIRDRYEEKMAVLRFEELAYWDDDAIPLEVFEAIVRLIAQDAAKPLGEEVPLEQDTENGGNPMQVGVIGMRMLRRHMRRYRSGKPTKIHAF
jgi:hypothetical protein